MPPHPEPAIAATRAAIAQLVRDEGPRVLATLVRTTGSLQVAEDAIQDAIVRALETWPRDGTPAQPRAWLTVTARRRAIDLLRREARRDGKEHEAVELLGPPDEPLPSEEVVRDDLLRLLFTCCHPTLDPQTQAALALRTLCGLSTAEIGRALLVPEPTAAKRLTRARQKIAIARIPYRTPAAHELPERLRGVLATVYLLFNEGYAATGGEDPIRRELTARALRLARLLRDLLPDEAGVLGLLALLQLQDARSAARLDDGGDLILLRDQDRSRWDAAAIRDAVTTLGVALRRTPSAPDPYVVQAAIAACHALAASWEETDWTAIVSWYDVLLAVWDTPVVRLNRAVAIAELDGAAAALVELERIVGLADYPLSHAVHAELLARSGRVEHARAAYHRALALPGNRAHHRWIARRLVELGS